MPHPSPRSLAPAAALALLAACVPGRAPDAAGGGAAPAAGVAATSVDSLVLEREPCFGFCPVYRLRLAADGRVRFESRQRGDSGRVETDSLDPARVRALVDSAARLGLADFPERLMGSPLCGRQATDMPTATVVLHAPSGTTRVVDYHGCMPAEADSAAARRVERLRAFEAMIDSVAGTARWLRPPGGR
jgi:hypothetical protein